MAWERKWTLTAPGLPPGTTVGFDDRSASILIADGWGVAFSALEARRIDASSGRVLASVRTRTSIRAFGRASAGDAFFFVGDKKLFLHDATTLDRQSVCDRRVPRYCNAVCDLGDGTVALAAPNALVEYDWRAGAGRRISKVKPVALGRIDGRALCLLSDGTILARAAGWESPGSLRRPHYTGSIDERSGVVAALAGESPSPYGKDGNPQPWVWPRSQALTIATVRGRWSVRQLELPVAAFTVGVVRGAIVAIGTTAAGQIAVASAELEAPERAITVEELRGQFVGFAGSAGLMTSSGAGDRDVHQLSMFEQVS